ncbi:chromosome transmission fidelity protein 8 homolog [Striga asiatica]|uniref:Chromosome transmission fidelity protein 8 homolog n=1 Tax=Striga asiatica TaxID=4170 RepID=A0A5A7PQT6_STRAF|nr:chromosome transmission fidelity protein 8 homolog [Striga asiatica]
MQIKVKCSCGEDRCPEWAVVEVQGVVEAQPSFQDRLQNLEIGLLCRPSSQESYTFTVGYHELTGTKVSLKKPILVLKRIKLDDEVKEGEGSSNSKRVELDVIGVIRHKILFKTRPRALISTKGPQQSGKERITTPSSMELN